MNFIYFALLAPRIYLCSAATQNFYLFDPEMCFEFVSVQDYDSNSVNPLPERFESMQYFLKTMCHLSSDMM